MLVADLICGRPAAARSRRRVLLGGAAVRRGRASGSQSSMTRAGWPSRVISETPDDVAEHPQSSERWRLHGVQKRN